MIDVLTATERKERIFPLFSSHKGEEMEIRKEAVRSAQMLTEALKEILKLTEAHINSLPKTGLMGNADETAKRKSVPRHYKFVEDLGGAFSKVAEQRCVLLTAAEKLDELSSKAEFEVLEEFSASARLVFELLGKIDETERVSGRFLGALDRVLDVTGKGENADFNSAARICREYFEFITNTRVYIDNFKFF